MDLFEIASRKKLRVQTSKGELSVEMLWDLPLKANGKLSLDDIAKHLHEKIETHKVSFVDETETVDNDNKVLFDIVLHIIKTRKKEVELATKRASDQSTLRLLREIQAKKKLEDLESLSSEELEAKIRELESQG